MYNKNEDKQRERVTGKKNSTSSPGPLTKAVSPYILSVVVGEAKVACRRAYETEGKGEGLDGGRETQWEEGGMRKDGEAYEEKERGGGEERCQGG